MLASIDSPQGDQVERIAAIAATQIPAISSAICGARRIEARMPGADPGSLERGIDTVAVLGRLALGECVAEQAHDSRPCRSRAFADDDPALDVHEVRAARNGIVVPCARGHDDVDDLL